MCNNRRILWVVEFVLKMVEKTAERARQVSGHRTALRNIQIHSAEEGGNDNLDEVWKETWSQKELWLIVVELQGQQSDTI